MAITVMIVSKYQLEMVGRCFRSWLILGLKKDGRQSTGLSRSCTLKEEKLGLETPLLDSFPHIPVYVHSVLLVWGTHSAMLKAYSWPCTQELPLAMLEDIKDSGDWPYARQTPYQLYSPALLACCCLQPSVSAGMDPFPFIFLDQLHPSLQRMCETLLKPLL